MRLYIPVEPPPTPAPSPRPEQDNPARLQYLASILHTCTPSELRFISLSIAPLLKRDFLRDLPIELGLHILSYIHDPNSLAYLSQVSKSWRQVVRDESVWRRMCDLYHFPTGTRPSSGRNEPLKELEEFADKPMDPALEWLASRPSEIRDSPLSSSSFHRFKYHYMTLQNWRHGGHLLREFSVPMGSNEREGGVITSVALDSEWVVVGSANSKIHVFSARTGVLHRVLVGHTSGVWSVGLVSRGGRPLRRRAADGEGEAWVSFLPASHREALGLDLDDEGASDGEETTSEPGGASEGWGQPNAIVVSAGCDQVIKVWEVEHGNCIHTLTGHTATIRSLKLLHRSPTAVTGARDRTVRVWDIQKGRMLRVLEGHEDRVRCVEVCGRRAVSGSYDGTCRMWDIDTGKCIHVLTGHRNQVYCVAFNGVYIASGGLDTVVRVWSAETGACLSILAGHTALVSQLQLSPASREEIARARNRSSVHIGSGSSWDVTDAHFPSYTYTSPTSISPPNSTSNSNSLSQSHSSPNPALNLPSTRPILATGGSDGRVITYDIESRQVVHRIAAHDAAVMALQFDEYFIVTAGSDGRVRVFETGSGRLVRDWYGNVGSSGYGYDVLSDVDPAAGMTNIPTPRYENVWKVVFGGSLWGASATGIGTTTMDLDKGTIHDVPDGGGDGLRKRERGRGRDICAVMCRKPGGRTVVEIWRMSPDMDVAPASAQQWSGEAKDEEDAAAG
ncbi:hypothetical protein PLEOSDRAFT_1113054 [Pleurotus ostreatus PC15]|uniref:F-box domain-containing protein n=1 Tax=Pleurotus ostreatus (strain PC15) TaxID=1137138 RepID=A0A067NQM5_PLEO1|nr:hypothetical protein PLEOSDRAFT_1113054 [Pleurotus ostreatus PC15]